MRRLLWIFATTLGAIACSNSPAAGTGGSDSTGTTGIAGTITSGATSSSTGSSSSTGGSGSSSSAASSSGSSSGATSSTSGSTGSDSAGSSSSGTTSMSSSSGSTTTTGSSTDTTSGSSGSTGAPLVCPPPDPFAVVKPLNLGGNDHWDLFSNQIGYAPLPNISDAGQTFQVYSAKFEMVESVDSPTSWTQEISIGPCPGVIDTSGGPLGTCYSVNNFAGASVFELDWIEYPVWGANTDANAQQDHLCEAYAADGPHYANTRFTYTGASCSNPPCGFVVNWNYSGYGP